VSDDTATPDESDHAEDVLAAPPTPEGETPTIRGEDREEDLVAAARMQAAQATANKLMTESPALRVCFSTALMAWQLYHLSRQMMDRYIDERRSTIPDADLVLQMLVQAAGERAKRPFETEELAKAMQTQGIGFVKAFQAQENADANLDAVATAELAKQRREGVVHCGAPLVDRDCYAVGRDKPTIVIGSDIARHTALDTIVGGAMATDASPPYRVVHLVDAESTLASTEHVKRVPLSRWRGKLANVKKVSAIIHAATRDMDGEIDMLVVDDVVRGVVTGAKHPATVLNEVQKSMRRAAKARGYALVIGSPGDQRFWEGQSPPPAVATAVRTLREHTYLRYVTSSVDGVVLQDGWHTFPVPDSLKPEE
jgi:hypothetical protein